MAGKLQVIIDPDTKQLLPNALEVTGSHTVAAETAQAGYLADCGICRLPPAIVHPSFDEATMLGQPDRHPALICRNSTVSATVPRWCATRSTHGGTLAWRLHGPG